MSLNHINIVTRNLEKTEQFFNLFGYEKTRGRHIEGEWLDRVTGLEKASAEYCALSHRNSPVTIELLSYHSPEMLQSDDDTRANKIGYRHIALEVENLAEMKLRIEAEGYQFLSDVQINSYGGRMCYCIGPDSLLVELLEL